MGGGDEAEQGAPHRPAVQLSSLGCVIGNGITGMHSTQSRHQAVSPVSGLIVTL